MLKVKEKYKGLSVVADKRYNLYEKLSQKELKHLKKITPQYIEEDEGNTRKKTPVRTSKRNGNKSNGDKK